MKQDVFPVGQGARKRRSQWLAFGIFKLLSYRHCPHSVRHSRFYYI